MQKQHSPQAAKGHQGSSAFRKFGATVALRAGGTSNSVMSNMGSSSKGLFTPMSPQANDLKYQTMQFFNSPHKVNHNDLGGTMTLGTSLALQSPSPSFQRQRNKSVAYRAETAATVVETLASFNVQAKQTYLR